MPEISKSKGLKSSTAADGKYGRGNTMHSESLPPQLLDVKKRPPAVELSQNWSLDRQDEHEYQDDVYLESESPFVMERSLDVDFEQHHSFQGLEDLPSADIEREYVSDFGSRNRETRASFQVYQQDVWNEDMEYQQDAPYMKENASRENQDAQRYEDEPFSDEEQHLKQPAFRLEDEDYYGENRLDQRTVESSSEPWYIGQSSIEEPRVPENQMFGYGEDALDTMENEISKPKPEPKKKKLKSEEIRIAALRDE